MQGFWLVWGVYRRDSRHNPAHVSPIPDVYREESDVRRLQEAERSPPRLQREQATWVLCRESEREGVVTGESDQGCIQGGGDEEAFVASWSHPYTGRSAIRGVYRKDLIPGVYRRERSRPYTGRIWSPVYTGEKQRHAKDGAGHTHLIVMDKTLKPDEWNCR